MTLRLKVVLFVSALFILVGVSLFFLFNATVMKGFGGIEEESALHHASRAQAEIQTLANELALLAARWGARDDSYNYVQGGGSEYELLLSYDTLEQLQVRHFLIQDLAGKTLTGGSSEPARREILPLASATLEHLSRVSKIALERRSKIGTLVYVGEEAFLVGTAPITNSAGNAAFKGTILFSQTFGEEAFARLRSLVDGSIRIEKIAVLKQDKDLGPAFERVLASTRSVPFATSLRMYGLDAVTDAFGTPILGLVAGQTRELHSKGIQARNLVVLCVFAFTLIGIVLASILINRGVVKPLREIGQQAKVIGEQQSDEMRVELRANAEIAELSTEINRMLEQLSLSKLGEVSARRTAESANEEKSVVIGKLSQELRTSLTTILGMHHMLLKKESSEANRSLVAHADKSAWELIATINKILNFSMLDSEDSGTDAGADTENVEQLFSFAKKLRVLIADDTPTNRIVLEELLREAGHSVISVDDGKDLLDRLTPSITGQPNSEQFDIVLTDISMPILDGYAATRAIRELEAKFGRKVSVPIIAVTAHAMPDEHQKMREAGIDGVVTKPIRPDEVSAEFRRLLPNLQTRAGQSD